MDPHLGTAAWWACTAAGQIRLPIPAGAQWTVLAGLAAASAVWWLLPRLPLSARINRWLEARWGLESGRWTPQQHRGQIVLSGLRYAVFATQFAAALAAWGIEWDLALYTTIAVVYLGNMIVPTAALAELGVREALLVAWMQPPGSCCRATRCSLPRLGGQPRAPRTHRRWPAIQRRHG